MKQVFMIGGPDLRFLLSERRVKLVSQPSLFFLQIWFGYAILISFPAAESGAEFLYTPRLPTALDISPCL